MNDENLCAHLNGVEAVTVSNEHVCAECVKHKTWWVHLRTCQSCGVTLCCDSSPQTHMTRHYHTSGHPVVASAEAGERWLWCYADKVFVEY